MRFRTHSPKLVLVWPYSLLAISALSAAWVSMPQPTPYDRQFSFSQWTAQFPSTPQPGDKMDLEFNAIKATLDEILANLKLIQRDDGEVANETIGLDQLKPEVTDEL